MAEVRLSSLTISNFQYWDYLELDLTNPSDGTPYSSIALFGEQGSGKSTLMRALRWLAYGDLGLGVDRTYPTSWGGRQKADQVVRAKLVRKTDRGADTVVLERRKDVGDRVSRIAIGVEGGARLEGSDAEPMWKNLVGAKPKAHEGALWMIRREEMERIHRSLAGQSDQGYLLQFYNQTEMLSRLDAVVEEQRADFARLLQASKGLEKYADEYSRLKKRYDEKKEALDAEVRKRDACDALVARNQLSDQDKAILEDGRAFLSLKADEAEARLSLSQAYLQREGVSRVVNATLAALLIEEGLADEIPKDTLPDEYDWDDIAAKLASQISPESLGAIQQLAERKRGLDLGALRQALPSIESRLEEVERLRDARREANRLASELRAYEAHNITSQLLERLETKNSVLRDAVEGAGEARVQIKTLKTELQELQELRDQAAKRFSGADGARQSLEAKRLSMEAGKALAKALRKAERRYREDMFNAAIVRLARFWEETSASDVFEPALSSGDGSIVLRKRDTQEEFKILLEDQGKGPSSGESEQLLVCMAMALADQAQIRLPLILDDVHTRIDNNTRPGVFRIATKFADQVIFVTNDENKLREMAPFIDAEVRLRKAKLDEEPHDTRSFDLVTSISGREA